MLIILLLIIIILFAIQAVYDIDKNFFFLKRKICFVTLYINNVLNSMYV